MGSPMTAGNILTPRNAFTRVLFLATFCAVLFLYTLRPIADHPRNFHQEIIAVSNVTQPHPRDCSLDSSHLQLLQQKYGLEDDIDYARRYVRFHRQDIKRQSITKLDKDLFPKGFDRINIQNPPMKTTCLKPLEVPVPNSPSPKTVDASDLLFGVSTTFKRLTSNDTNPMKEWAHWLTDGNGKSNGAGLVLRLVDATNEEIQEAKTNMTGMGIDVKVYHSSSSDEMAARYLSLLPALYNDSSRKSRKFLVMCDDDTFFPSVHSLLSRLSTYDHKEELYIGTFSEDVNNIQRHGSQAFGGAGVFFSVPLAEKIAALYDQCSTSEKITESNTGWGPQGDILLRKCIYENTEVRLSMLRDLHQLDIQGDPAGFYEAGLFPLSLHHFKGGFWHEAKPYAGAQVIHACGEACFLQRFQTKDNFIISNGYSVAQYPKGINFNVHQMERTFKPAPDDYGWNLDFMLGPGRKSLAYTGRKVAWELKEARVQEDGSVLQTYVRKLDDRRWSYQEGNNWYRMMEKDGIVELVWIP
ncbi:uncharacterized protein PAC_09446 [Phialocephala subalpina]|uniref:Glycosyltransferase family 31 protein n=1 Tax=Phialocephala subalpina TaxID=576137 RepID=A0A1L7X3E7_9HELO|nr:uncharacterized protein PAC_09446 [Phialocephala subalpina]